MSIVDHVHDFRCNWVIVEARAWYMMVVLSFHGMSGITHAFGMFTRVAMGVGIVFIRVMVVARMGVLFSRVAGGGERDRDRDLP